MKKRLTFALLTFCFASILFAQTPLPHLQKKGDATQLIVHGKPFLILGGELGNSSASSMEYMAPIWPKLKAMHLNTALAPVYWELIEPEEGQFDFSLVDQLITEARQHDLKLVLLWFATWKNSMSSHVPAWVKKDQERFPRAKDDTGRSQEILTPFNDENLKADLRAFASLMKHLKDFDNRENTVVMVQVENEIGMLPSARDYHPLANAAFESPVPTGLVRYMQEHKAILAPELLNAWQKNGSKTSGTWEALFGKGLHTDEFFMAWYFSKFTNQIVEAGKAVYPLPMFVNAALNRPGRLPGSGYPSAGPLPHVMDIWKAAGPSIDFLSPAVYNPQFRHWNDLYTRQGNPLFIPEHRFDETVAGKAVFAIGHYNALGFAPFSIESTDKAESEPLGKMYALLKQLHPLIADQQGQGKMEGVLFDKETPDTVITLGKYRFTCKHDFTLGWSPGASADQWPTTGALILRTGEDEYFFAGTGVVVTFEVADDKNLMAGILRAEEGLFVDDVWKPGRRLNGDQIHQGRHVRIPAGEFGIQKVEFYVYR